MTNTLSIKGLDVRFGDTHALRGIDLELRGGQVTGFVGPNGAGKSTTMRAIFGLVEPASGELRWNGEPIVHEDRHRFGYMPEERGLYAKMRIVDQMAYFARLNRVDAKTARTSAEQLVERLGLQEYVDKPLEKLSLGNQQRVQLGVALIHEPDLLVLDEPFSGLDPTGIQVMSRTLVEEGQRGAAILFSSHQLDLVERISDQVAVLRRGEIVANGTIDELRADRYRQHYVVDVETADEDWWRGIAGIEPLESENGKQRFRAERPGSEDELLAGAMAAGHLRAFYPAQPPLTTIFNDLVAA